MKQLREDSPSANQISSPSASAQEAQMTIGFFLGLFGSITSELEELPDGRQKGAAQAKEDVSATANH